MPKAAAHKRRRVASSLRDMIATLAVGDRLPSVPELERHFGVAKSTVEAAVGELQAEGLIVRRQGSGTFVARLVSRERAVRPRVGRIAMTSIPLAAPFEVYGEIFGAMAA